MCVTFNEIHDIVRKTLCFCSKNLGLDNEWIFFIFLLRWLGIKLSASVSDFLICGQWCIPDSFCQAFPSVATQIKGVLPYKKGDILIWLDSSSGKPSIS